jgi:hypothetical protein
MAETETTHPILLIKTGLGASVWQFLLNGSDSIDYLSGLDQRPGEKFLVYTP